jgi:transketolase
MICFGIIAALIKKNLKERFANWNEMRSTFVKTLVELARERENIFLLTADLGFKLFDEFRSEFSDRFVNVGVAEQNMVGIGAGLSLSGKNVYCYSMIPFLILRTLEFIRVDLCYQNLNVKLIGVGGGLTYGLEGMTHHAIEDIAIARALPNLSVAAPGDPVEARGIIRESVNYQGPLYIRLGGNNDPVIHKDGQEVSIGKGIVVKEGGDITLFCTGGTLSAAKASLEIVEKERGLRATLISVHTIKPLDTELVSMHAKKSHAVFTVEDHSVIGGLGSAVGETLLDQGYQGVFHRIGLPDQYSPIVGRSNHLKQIYGLTAEGIAERVMSVLKEKGGERR